MSVFDIIDGFASFFSLFATSPIKKVSEDYSPVPFSIVKVDGGSFAMGTTREMRYNNNAPEVVLKDFAIMETLVTQKLWTAVMGSNPSFNKQHSGCPVENVNWNDVQAFIKKINEITQRSYRLPTEAEWEYAAKGGKYCKFFQYAGSNKVSEVAWFDENSKSTQLVKQKKPNELGLYDMSGNVFEWCSDWSAEYSKGQFQNPTGPEEGTFRVIRGGAFDSNSDFCTVIRRNIQNPEYGSPFLGFRLVLPL